MKTERKGLLRVLTPVFILVLLIVSVIPVSACDTSCTLTLGYWKTHSSYGPAPYDSAWDYRDEDAKFYYSGLTNYQILWKAPKGNAYYILAKQWIAANLNMDSGATAPTEVLDAVWGWGYNYFINYTPKTGNKGSIRAEALYYANLLDQYNNGLIGPGHCEN